MKYVIIGKNMEVTPNLDEAVRDKLCKLDKFFAPDTTAHVTLSVDKDRHKIEVTIPVKGSIIRSEQVSNDMYVSIDLVEEVIERQIKKYKGKLIRRHQGGSRRGGRHQQDHRQHQRAGLGRLRRRVGFGGR